MTVYVDDTYIPATVGRYSSRWCHLFTDQDDPAELHELAGRIGLRRSWFQPSRRPLASHYDVTEGTRRQAVAAGAVEITWREAAQMRIARIEADRGLGEGELLAATRRMYRTAQR